MQQVSIKHIKANPNNPRLIKDDKFEKLVKSIKEFPQMLNLRPIVVNDDMVVLGGNMRLKACKEAGLKEVPVIKASDLTEEQQREFIIKDNVGFGEWDWDMIANEWSDEPIEEWGLDIPGFSKDDKREQSGANHPNYKEGKAVIRDYECKKCGKAFQSDKGHEGREPQYCSRKCAGKRLIVERPTKVCLQCSKLFQVKYMKGLHKFCSLQCAADNNGISMKGVKRPDKSGENAPGWKGGVTPVNEAARKSMEYKTWRTSVFQRDSYTCQECGKRGCELNADHIKPFALYPELRFEVSNGRTLCVPCHKKTPTYGGKLRAKNSVKTA